jgi:hypothetical protein
MSGTSARRAVLLGAGGHGLVVLALARAMGQTVEGGGEKALGVELGRGRLEGLGKGAVAGFVEPVFELSRRGRFCGH